MKIKPVLKKYRKLIYWTARRYSAVGSCILTKQDLESEGFLCLVQCCRGFKGRPKDFGRYFKTAWYNRLKDLMSARFAKKRVGVEVDLEHALHIPCVRTESRTILMDTVTSLKPLLSRGSYHFLQEMVDPSKEVTDRAWMEFCRRNKLRSLGIRAPGWKRCRVRTRHIRLALGMSRKECRKTLREIETAAQSLHGG